MDHVDYLVKKILALFGPAAFLRIGSAPSFNLLRSSFPVFAPAVFD